MIDHLIVIVICSLFSIGFLSFIQASSFYEHGRPKPGWDIKPINCALCLSGWGAIFFSLIYTGIQDQEASLAGLVWFLIYSVAGTGGAAIYRKAFPDFPTVEPPVVDKP
jgi:hypothetical protein